MEEIMKTNLEQGNSLMEFILGLSSFFEEDGFPVPQDFAQNSFAFFGEMGTEELARFYNTKALEPVLESMIVQNGKTHEMFHKEFMDYVKGQHVVRLDGNSSKNLRSIQQKRKTEEKRQADAKSRLDRLKTQSKILEKKLKNEDNSTLTERGLKSRQKKRSKIEEELQKLYQSSPKADTLMNLPRMANDGVILSKKESEELQSELKKLLKKAVLSPHYKELMEELRGMTKLLKEMEKKRNTDVHAEYERLQSETRNLESQYEATKRRLESIQKELEQNIQKGKTIQKKQAVIHRAEFIGGRNAVQSSELPKELKDKKLKQLTEKDRLFLQQYLKENAIKFRTRVSHNIKTGSHRKLDLPNTCKMACRTGGIPLKLEYVKPKRSKAKIILFLDVSGSCKEASEMMLLFMHELREVFPSGCDTYCFVNQLYDVTNIFKDSLDSQEATQKVLEAIPRKGVYSDYFEPLQSFCKEHLSSVTRDTIVVWIGDARNNKNQSGIDEMKKISRKAKHSYWLNTEKKERWNTADSIIGQYATYMDGVYEVLSLGQLASFLENMR